MCDHRVTILKIIYMSYGVEALPQMMHGYRLSKDWRRCYLTTRYYKYDCEPTIVGEGGRLQPT